MSVDVTTIYQRRLLARDCGIGEWPFPADFELQLLYLSYLHFFCVIKIVHRVRPLSITPPRQLI